MIQPCTIGSCRFEGHKYDLATHMMEDHFRIRKLYVCWCGYYTTVIDRMLSHCAAHVERGEFRPKEPFVRPDLQGKVGSAATQTVK